MQILTPILPIMEQIFGKLEDLKKEGKITQQSIDYVPIQWFES